jgi:hypothetical protein
MTNKREANSKVVTMPVRLTQREEGVERIELAGD